jgi:hypothetical protein
LPVGPVAPVSPIAQVVANRPRVVRDMSKA